MTDYSLILDELKDNLVTAAPDVSQMHWDNAKNALAAITDGRTKEHDLAKMVLVSTGTAVIITGWSIWNIHKLQQSYKKRDQSWRETFDSAMRIIDLLQSGEDPETLSKKVEDEMEFIRIVRDERLKES